MPASGTSTGRRSQLGWHVGAAAAALLVGFAQPSAALADEGAPRAWRAEEVADTGDRVPVDISLSTDTSTLAVDSFMAGRALVFAVLGAVAVGAAIGYKQHS
jgi:hypothetical protein